MRRIAHISDLHFGRVDGDVVEGLGRKVNELSPDLVVVSGDLTQRATRGQFAAAREFLDRLPTPQIVVPGNHDVPLYDLYARFFQPLRRYTEQVTGDLEPFFCDDEIAVIGVNTTRSFAIKDGRISVEQVERIRDRLSPLNDRVVRMVVSHHPFDLPPGVSESQLVGRAEKLLPLLAECGADVFLSGHLHISHTSNSAHRYQLAGGKTVLMLHAGTAASTRGRGEANSFNLLEVERALITVNRFEWADRDGGFVAAAADRFEKRGTGWSAA